MHFGLILATIPCLKPFIQPFEAEGKQTEADAEDIRGSVATTLHTPDTGLGFMFRNNIRTMTLQTGEQTGEKAAKKGRTVGCSQQASSGIRVEQTLV
jgi:hypothetical protein